MTKTPRTEAVVKMAVGPMREYAIIEHAQNLERELLKAREESDEARAELEMWRDGNILHEIHKDELGKVERERNELRDTIDDVLRALEAIEHEGPRSAAMRVKAERDQARRELDIQLESMTFYMERNDELTCDKKDNSKTLAECIEEEARIFKAVYFDSSEELSKAHKRRKEAQELARDLFRAGHELCRFARAYVNDYDEPDGKQGARRADEAFWKASLKLANFLGKEAK